MGKRKNQIVGCVCERDSRDLECVIAPRHYFAAIAATIENNALIIMSKYILNLDLQNCNYGQIGCVGYLILTNDMVKIVYKLGGQPSPTPNSKRLHRALGRWLKLKKQYKEALVLLALNMMRKFINMMKLVKQRVTLLLYSLLCKGCIIKKINKI
ncbi:hypothetical protein CR513_55775, partial [Mucuna pruriens]